MDNKMDAHCKWIIGALLMRLIVSLFLNNYDVKERFK
jgi:hypothetical protein